MRILVGTNLFHPLYGGGEKALIDWLIDLQDRNIEIFVITTVPEIESLEMEFPFEVIRLNKKIPYHKSIEEIGLHNYVQGLHYDYQELSNKALNIIKNMPRFDYYIGYGMWGSEWILPYYRSFAIILKENFPHIKTISLKWDVHGGEGNYDTDYVLHGAPYRYINNPHYSMASIQRFYLYPKQNTFKSIEKYDYEEWKNRPYDFIFNNLATTKGAETLYYMVQKLPHKKFLVKRGNWGEDNIYYNKFKSLDNVDIINRVKSMETDFFRKGRYLLYPSVLEGFGLMPMEAAMQGTIPICSDIEILRYSSFPYSFFVYSPHITNNPFNIIKNREEIYKFNWEEISQDWIEKIRILDRNQQDVKEMYDSLKLVRNHVNERYEEALTSFLNSFK